MSTSSSPVQSYPTRFTLKQGGHSVWVQRRIFKGNGRSTVFVRFICCSNDQRTSDLDVLNELTRLHDDLLGHGKWMYDKKYGPSPCKVVEAGYQDCERVMPARSPWDCAGIVGNVDRRLSDMERFNKDGKLCSLKALDLLQLEIQLLDSKCEARNKRIRTLLASSGLKHHLLNGSNRVSSYQPTKGALSVFAQYRQLPDKDKKEELDGMIDELCKECALWAREKSNLLRLSKLTFRHVLYLKRKSASETERRLQRSLEERQTSKKHRRQEKSAVVIHKIANKIAESNLTAALHLYRLVISGYGRALSCGSALHSDEIDAFADCIAQELLATSIWSNVEEKTVPVLALACWATCQEYVAVCDGLSLTHLAKLPPFSLDTEDAPCEDGTSTAGEVEGIEDAGDAFGKLGSRPSEMLKKHSRTQQELAMSQLEDEETSRVEWNLEDDYSFFPLSGSDSRGWSRYFHWDTPSA